jgi:hypothetical protein
LYVGTADSANANIAPAGAERTQSFAPVPAATATILSALAVADDATSVNLGISRSLVLAFMSAASLVGSTTH